MLLSDTVGFVRNLPHELVEAFKSTLDEVVEADLLIHVVDSSAFSTDGNIAAVDEVLASIGASDVPQLLVFNKTDIAWPERLESLRRRYPASVAISAYSGEGVDELLEVVADRVRALTNVIELFIPYDRGDLLAAVHREGEVLVESHEEHGTRVRARLDGASAGKFREVRV